MFWALFVVGHDCGHGSFSRYRWLNNLIGHLSHTPILVPFHGWRISHRTHHANTGNIDTDESWYPVTETQYNNMAWYEKLARFQLILFVYPLYLFRRSPNKQGSHFMPESPLFRPSERWQVLTSTVCCTFMLGLLIGLGISQGFWFLFNYYIMPYIVFVVWLDLVTFLHHTEDDIPWYRGQDWYFLKGALSTIDRDYGIFIRELGSTFTLLAILTFHVLTLYYLIAPQSFKSNLKLIIKTTHRLAKSLRTFDKIEWSELAQNLKRSIHEQIQNIQLRFFKKSVPVISQQPSVLPRPQSSQPEMPFSSPTDLVDEAEDSIEEEE